MIQVHGVNYSTTAEMIARLAELEALNAEIGLSDGRVTEAVALNLELAKYSTIPDPAAVAAPAEPTYAQVIAAKPFYAYYRTSKGGKGISRFATRKGLDGFMDRTPHAVTAHN